MSNNMPKVKTKQTNKQNNRSQETLVAGSAWMSGSSIVSRLLGALYIIPWMALMGDNTTAGAANALMNIGYTPYALFLNIATAGVPSSISKQVSYYNSIGEYSTGKKIYKKGLQVMGLTGIISAILMYVLAPLLASASPAASIAEGTQVIRSLTPALLIIPMMSVTRGYIQGHNTMAPSAISQVLEQFVRVGFMILSVFLIRIILGSSVVNAVSLSTFGAFIGALASSLYLGYVVWSRKNEFQHEVIYKEKQQDIKTNVILISIVKTAIPFVFIGSGITLSQLIDQYTYGPVMSRITTWTPGEIQVFYGVAAANAHKLIMIVLSLGSAMAVTSVPLMSSLVAEKNLQGVGKQFSNSIQLLFLVLFPSSLGMLVLASPLYTLFYEFNVFGTEMTRVSSIMTLFLGLYTVLGSNLLAANMIRTAIKALLIGLLVKLIVQIPLFAIFGTSGMIYANMIGFGLSSYLMMRAMYAKTYYDYKKLGKRLMAIGALSTIMTCTVWGTKSLLSLFINPVSRSGSVLIIIIATIVGISVYGYLILKTRLADHVTGNSAEKIRSRLRIQ